MTTLTPSFSDSITLARPSASARVLHYFALGGVVLIAVWLHFYRLDQEGYANRYYAAAVKSMLTSAHNFFFVSFDPGGFVTVDKPPLGLWIQAASAMVFGFSGWALLFPQALAGVLSVALLYYLVRRVFGPPAALIAALVLAVTPISVAANRNNTMDGTLVFTLLLAAWAITLAAEKGKLRWLLASAFLVGVGFNIKMLQAFLVLPAFYLVYLFAPIAWWKRILHLALASVVLAIVSLAWVVVVDLTPPDQRPFIGSSHNNTVTELIIGHNGLARVFRIRPGGTGDDQPRDDQPPAGQPPQGQPPAFGNQPPDGQPPVFGNQPPAGQPPFGRPPAFGNQPPIQQPPMGQPSFGQPPANQPQPDGPRGGLGQETGEPSLTRLFNEQLAGQISWLLPLAAIGLIAAAWQTRLRWPLAREHQSLLLWGAWLLPQIIFFSVANLFHRYYLEMMAPAIAALVGAGIAAMWNDHRRDGWRRLILPLAFLTSAAVEVFILAAYPDWSRWLSPIIVGLTLIASLVLLIRRSGFLARAAAALGVIALLIAPAIWSLTPVLAAGDSGLPYASPELLERPKSGGAPNVDKLVNYLIDSRDGETFLAATVNARDAAPIILATGEPVMAMGGFSGSDRILSTDELAQMVADGEVRFFLLPNERNRQSELTRWVANHCAVVPSELWQDAVGSGLFNPVPGANAGQPRPPQPPRPPQGPGGAQQLYDCGDSGK